MLTYTYVSEGTFALMEKPKPVLQHERDAIVKVTLASICSSDLHIKHGGVDGCDCEETLRLIAEGKIDTEPLITHTYPLRRIAEGYELFEKKRDGVIKVAVEC
mgnify:CR=1 FL=1